MVDQTEESSTTTTTTTTTSPTTTKKKNKTEKLKHEKKKKKKKNVSKEEKEQQIQEDDRLLPFLLQHLNKDNNDGNNNENDEDNNTDDDDKKHDQNNNNRHDDKNKEPYRKLPTRLKHVPNDLLTKGYSIVPNVFTENECNDALDQLWDFVQDTSGNMVQRNEPKSWYPKHQLKPFDTENKKLGHEKLEPQAQQQKQEIIKAEEEGEEDPWPHTGYSSFPDMFQSLGAGFLLGRTRLQMAQRIFEPLLGTKDLHASKEGFTFSRPTLVSTTAIPANPTNITSTSSSSNSNSNSIDNDDDEKDETNPTIIHQWHRSKEMTTRRVCGQIQEHSLGEHYDQAHHIKGLQTIQSSVCFIDQNPSCGDGHFACIPFSHSQVHNSLTKDIYRGKFAWVPLMQEEINKIREDDLLQLEHVYVNAGDVILWRSDLIHAAVPPKEETFHFRAVGYFSMSPASWTPNYPNVWTDKMNSYKWSKTGDHRSFVESWHDHKRQTLNVPNFKSMDEKSRSDDDDDKEKMWKGINWIIARQRPYFRYKPPTLTTRLAELYGLVPLNLTSPEAYQKAVERAIVRGARFVDDVNDLDNVKHRNSNPSQPLCTALSQQISLVDDKLLLGQDKYLGGEQLSYCNELNYTSIIIFSHALFVCRRLLA